MENSFRELGLNYDLIASKYADIEEYKNIVRFYLNDEFFLGMQEYLENEDYALAKDACKGLFILAQDLYLYPLYIALMEVYEDLEDKTYDNVLKHYEEMKLVYDKFRGAF